MITVADLQDALANYVPAEDLKRHELTNGQWAVIRPLLPEFANRRGRPRNSRQVLNGMLWILRTGAPWRDLPERYGPHQTVWDRFDAWRKAGVLAAIRERLLELLNDAGGLDWDLWCVDGTSIRAARAAAGARKKKKGEGQANHSTTRSADRAEALAPRSTSGRIEMDCRWRQ